MVNIPGSPGLRVPTGIHIPCHSDGTHSPGAARCWMQGSTRPVLLSGWAGEVCGHRGCHPTGSEEPRRLEPYVGCFQLTTQPSGGIAPVGTYTLGPAQCCIGLQALTERVSNIGVAVVTDTGSEEGIWRDELVALGEDPVTVSGQGWELHREAGQANHCPGPPPQRPTHWLSISSQRGAEGHGVEVSGLDPGVCGVVLGEGLGSTKQPLLPFPGTSQSLAMSWQSEAMVPSGRRQSSVWLFVQVPGEEGRDYINFCCFP